MKVTKQKYDRAICMCVSQGQTLTSTVGEAVENIPLLAQTLKTAGVVDTGVITGPLKGTLVYV